MSLLILALAPFFIILFYIYIRDKYEKEPVFLLLTGVIYGILIAVPIVLLENVMLSFTPNYNQFIENIFTAFFGVALIEEGFKFIILFFLVWKNNNFNEWFDGIVYSVFISLGFAGIENILYVINPDIGGFSTGISRAIFSVPAHGLFAVFMGYYFSISKFKLNNKKYLIYSFVSAWLLHSIYDYILMLEMKYIFIVFIAFVMYLWIDGFKKMKKTHRKLAI